LQQRLVFVVLINNPSTRRSNKNSGDKTTEDLLLCTIVHLYAVHTRGGIYTIGLVLLVMDSFAAAKRDVARAPYRGPPPPQLLDCG
jgi:hypothetical protein